MSRFPLLLLLGFVVLMSIPSGAQEPPRANLVESYRRQDPTGMGSFHRNGLFRELENTLAAATGETEPSAAEQAGWKDSLNEMLTLQLRANTLLFGSNNIFNTEEDEQTDIQYAQFLGVSLDAQFNDQWKLQNSFDQAWFYHGKSENAGSDFITSTFRQALSYDRFFFDNKVALSIPLSWQFSRLLNRASGDRTLDTYTYGAATEFSWFLKSWLIPTFSYQYSYQDSGSPAGPVPDKHKHDFNLGLLWIPFEGEKFFVIPSVQYSHEQFIGQVRRDNAWTPTLTVSWQPLKFLAFDAVGSYTTSDSTVADSSFDALTGSFFMRLFYSW